MQGNIVGPMLPCSDRRRDVLVHAKEIRRVIFVSLNLSEFVEGRSWSTCEQGGIAEVRVFAGDWISSGPERRHTSASIDALL